MPKKVDHRQRRRTIAEATARIAAQRGVHHVSFRTVGAEVGMSVAAVQHYVGSKKLLLVSSADVLHASLIDDIVGRIAELAPDSSPLDRLRVIAESLLPTDDRSRVAVSMLQGLTVAALTDEELRRANVIRDDRHLHSVVVDHLEQAQAGGVVAADTGAELEATAILSLVSGLSLRILLDATTPAEAVAVLDAQIERLAA